MKHQVWTKMNCQHCKNRIPCTEENRKYLKRDFDKYDWCDADDAYVEKARIKACHLYKDREKAK